MAINFPNSPAPDQEFESSGVKWKYDGEKWVSQASGDSGGGASVTVSETPPGTAESGDLWYDSSTDEGRLYVYYVDDDSSQWVDASPAGGGDGSGVSQIVAGTNVTISPVDGKGIVTINASGDGGPTTPGVRYQEGTWTPVFSSGGMISPQATWTRSGNTVFLTLDGNWDPIPSGGNMFEIDGIPYTSNIYASGSLYVQNKDSEVVAVPFSYKNLNKISVKGVSTKAANTETFNLLNGFFKGGYCNITLVYSTDDTTFAPSTGAVVTEDIQGTGGSGGGTTINYNGASAWGSVAADGTISGSQNIASVVKDSTGKYIVTFTTPMPNADYAVVVSGYGSANYTAKTTSRTTNNFNVIIDGGDSEFSFAVHAENAIAPQSGVGADAWAHYERSPSGYTGYNIASVTKVSGGLYQFNFITPMPTADYAVVATVDMTDSKQAVILSADANGFRIQVFSSVGDISDSFGFINVVVHASSTVTPTYTWTRNGTTLVPANAGDIVEVGNTSAANDEGGVSLNPNLGQIDVLKQSGDSGYYITGSRNTGVGSTVETNFSVGADGSADFAGPVTVGPVDVNADTGNGIELYTAPSGQASSLTIQIPSTGLNNTTSFNTFKGKTRTSTIFADGSASFAGGIFAQRSSANRGEGTIAAQQLSTGNCFEAKDSTGTVRWHISSTGSASYSGTIEFNLEPDNPANYTATMVDGEEQQVYSGPTLDVKELLLTLQTAAERIKTLEAKVQSLEGGS